MKILSIGALIIALCAMALLSVTNGTLSHSTLATSASMPAAFRDFVREPPATENLNLETIKRQ
jgi:hypothetical protein